MLLIDYLTNVVSGVLYDSLKDKKQKVQLHSEIKEKVQSYLERHKSRAEAINNRKLRAAKTVLPAFPLHAVFLLSVNLHYMGRLLKCSATRSSVGFVVPK